MASIAEWREAIAVARAARPRRKAKGESKAFYASLAWKRARYAALSASNGRCQCCGASPAEGEVLQVDHIEPLSKCWDRRLDPGNLQVLCGSCNHGKLDGPARDWRPLNEARVIGNSSFSLLSVTRSQRLGV